MIEPRHIQQAIERTLTALAIAQHKPSPKGQGGGSSSVEAPLPLPVGIISAKRELRDILLLWVDLVSDGLDVVANCDPTEIDMLQWLAGHERASHLAAHDAGMDFLDELTTVTKSLESPYLARNGYKYIGNVSGSPIHAKEGQREVTLHDGETMTLQAVRDTVANELLDYEGTAEKVALIIREYFGHELTAKKIAKTQDNDKRTGKTNPLTPTNTVGRNHTYTVESVLNRLFRKENHTRS